MAFFEDPPEVANAFTKNPTLRSWLHRVLPPACRAEVEAELFAMGELARGPLLDLSRRHRTDEPRHVPFDAWGRRVDHVEVNEAWETYARVAVERGLVATGYERRLGAFSRVHQFALVHLFAPSSQTYTCPLAMTDGCARTLELVASPVSGYCHASSVGTRRALGRAGSG